MLGCTLASAVLAVGCGYLAAKAASGFSFTVREKLFRHVMDIGSEEMQDFSVASLITRTTNDITQIQMIVAMGLQMMIKSPIMAVWAINQILGKSWELSAVTAAFVVVICVTVITVMSICIPRFRIVQKLTDQINRVARENLTGINVVHAFNAEQYQNDKFNKPSLDMMNVQVKNQKLFALVQPTMTLGMNGLALTIYWLGAALVNNIALTDSAARLTMFSDVLVFSTYATYVVMSFMMLVMIFMLLPQAQVSAERINEVLERKANIREGSVSECKEHGTVEFKNVSFRYPHTSEDELSNISFRVNRGETLAVIGATGSGKTTLVSLIPRFYDATEGEVLVDGVNVRDYTFDTLYNKLGYVTQKAVLFAGSIRDNVYFGESEAPADDEALRRPSSFAGEGVCRQAPRRYAAPCGADGPQHVRRPEAAPFHRPRAGEKTGDPCLRRFVLRSGLPHGCEAARGAIQAAARHDEDHRRAAHQHYPPCRQDHRARPRRDRGHRHA